MTYYDSFGQKWYYNLISYPDREIKGMFEYESRKSLLNKLVVAINTKDGSILYKSFQNYIEFNKYQSRLTPDNRCFFEEILGEHPQKLYFDLDINFNTPSDISGLSGDLVLACELVKDNLIITILEVFATFGIELKVNQDILVCTSHSDIKKSYHVIVDNYCFPDCDHTKAMFQIIKSKLNKDYKHPDLLYKSLQQLRILGSQKRDSNRPKVFCSKWLLGGIPIEYDYPSDITNNTEVRELYQLSRTLIGNTSYCKTLPYISINEAAMSLIKMKRKFGYSLASFQIQEDVALRAFNKLADFAGMSPHDPKFPYRYDRIVDNMVLLKRVLPSECRICKVIHESQHPYLFITKIGQLYFDCRRSADHGDGTPKKLYIGDLDGIVGNSIGTVSEIDLLEDEDELELKPLNLDDRIKQVDTSISSTILPIQQIDNPSPNVISPVQQIDTATPSIMSTKTKPTIKSIPNVKKYKEYINKNKSPIESKQVEIIDYIANKSKNKNDLKESYNNMLNNPFDFT